MATTTVTAKLLDANGVARVGEYVFFRLKTLGADKTNDELFPPDVVDAITDANGEFSETLWVNGDSDIVSVWEILFPGKGRYDVIIPSSAGGGTIDLADLISDHQAGTAEAQLSTVYALAIQRSNHTGTQTLSTISDAGTAAASDTGDFATAAQGALADSAIQPGDIDTYAELDAIVADETLAKASDIGVSIQAHDDALDSIALLGTAADKGIYTTAADTFAEFDLSEPGRNLIDDLSISAQRSTLGLATNIAPGTTTVTSTTYTILNTDSVVLVDDDTAGAAVTVTLLTAAAAGDGFTIAFKKLGTTGNVTIDGDGSETIDGETTLVLTGTNDSAVIQSDGSNWIVLDSYNEKFDEIALNTSASAGSYEKGVIRWNDTFKCPEYDNGDDSVTNQIGQESHVRVINQSGSDILDGKVVRINGASGSLATIVLAQADIAANATGVIGLATHDIESTTEGTITTFGRVNNIDTSSFSAGDVVYLDPSTAGGLTLTPPPLRVKIGVVMVAHATTGSILVDVESNAPEYGDIHVKGGSATQALSTSFAKITAFTTDGNDSGSVSDAANNKLVLTRGVWRVHLSASVSSSAGDTAFSSALFLDGTEQDQLQAKTFMKTANEVTSMPISGMVVVDQATEDLDFRLKVDTGTPNVTVVHANLSAHKI